MRTVLLIWLPLRSSRCIVSKAKMTPHIHPTYSTTLKSSSSGLNNSGNIPKRPNMHVRMKRRAMWRVFVARRVMGMIAVMIAFSWT